VDIAGLVRGASAGEGMGNAFLSHVREVDAIVQVVRCFESAPGGEDITHVEGSIDPIRDINTIEAELVLADMQVVENALPKAERQARTKEPDAIARLSALQAVAPILDTGTPIRTANLAPEHAKALRSLGLITAKSNLYLMNVDDSDVLGESAHCRAVRAHAAAVGAEAIPVCAKIESELAELDEADRAEMLADMGLDEPALAKFARAAYTLLGLQSFYTAGPKEIRAWTIPRGARAPQAAGVIHTDFERGFIRAEIYSVADLEELGSEKAIREAGRMRTEGKDYVMRDADVCNFLFNV